MECCYEHNCNYSSQTVGLGLVGDNFGVFHHLINYNRIVKFEIDKGVGFEIDKGVI